MKCRKPKPRNRRAADAATKAYRGQTWCNDPGLFRDAYRLGWNAGYLSGRADARRKARKERKA